MLGVIAAIWGELWTQQPAGAQIWSNFGNFFLTSVVVGLATVAPLFKGERAAPRGTAQRVQVVAAVLPAGPAC